MNYDESNMNIAFPVFAIHGDRDDPCGFDGLSSLDVLATTGLVNYFGRSKDEEKIEINPILMKKGESQLALYGLSYIHNDRLKQILNTKNVVMHQPDESTGGWFNVLVLHQNRADRGPKNFVPEEILPEFLNLVVWGHEHECRIQPEKIPAKKIFVTQPGSSVVTSLSKEESFDKHIGVLHVRGDEFQIIQIKLKTVRPFIFKEINLDDHIGELQLDEGNPISKVNLNLIICRSTLTTTCTYSFQVREFLKEKIDEMIGDAASKNNPDCPEQPKLPLIHLRVNYTNDDYIFNLIRFGQQYVDEVKLSLGARIQCLRLYFIIRNLNFPVQVANPMDMIKFIAIRKRVKRACEPIDEDAMNRTFQDKQVKT